MAEHVAVARRFAELLDSLDLSRSGFVAAVDEAVSERTLYSILNGNRRPSRSLAVLIERTWGFRADYLLHGEEPVWLRAGTEAPDTLSADEAAVLAMMSESPELARTLRRDLDDSALWTALWERTTRMLQGLVDDSDSSSLNPAARARIAFSECLSVADAFGELNATRYQRRLLHLVVSFIDRALQSLLDDPESGLDADVFRALLAEAETAREQLGIREGSIRTLLTERVQAASPIDEYAGLPPAMAAGRELSTRISEALIRHRLAGIT
jgi:hypothetical protein